MLGGGVLGLEIAWHLRQRGLQVVVLECLERLLPRQCTAEGSALLKQRLEEAGVSVELNYVSENISCGENQSGLSLHAKDGRVCKGDFLLISAGMAPRKSLAEKSGIACKNGILVNERLETSCPDVYAAGDCAEGPVRNPGMWICSKEQGEGAADILTGKLEKFTFRERQPMLKIGSLDLTGIRS